MNGGSRISAFSLIGKRAGDIPPIFAAGFHPAPGGIGEALRRVRSGRVGL